MPQVALPYIALAITAAGTGAAIHQGEKQREAVANQEGRMASAAQAQKDALAAQQADAKNAEDALYKRNAEKASLKRGAMGRAGTILTGPLGVTGGAPAPGAVTGKTMLGS